MIWGYTQWEVSFYNPGYEASPHTESADPLILDFPASKTQKCIFVVATQTDEKHLLRVVVSTKFIIIVVG
jgi:hypothetical protein